MVFNRINFHGHLRLSGVCKRWLNLVQNDVVFMRSVRFDVRKMKDHHTLVRSYKFVYLNWYGYGRQPDIIPENMQQLLKNAEIIDFGYSAYPSDLNRIIPFCENAKDIRLGNSTSDKTVLTFSHPFPVQLSMVKARIENSMPVLDRFSAITKLSGMMEIESKSSEEFLAKYAGVTTALAVRLNSSFDKLSQFENLHLESVRLWEYEYARSEKESVAVQVFFEQQAASLKSIEIVDIINEYFFDPMRMLLVNLEKVKIRYSTRQNLRINNLKVLPKLKFLDLAVIVPAESEFYHLDVGELITLNELSISNKLFYGPHVFQKLRIISHNQPMNMLKKFVILKFNFDHETSEQIVWNMPRLKVLEIISDHCVSKHEKTLTSLTIDTPISWRHGDNFR
jgi:plasmid maintenance system antidote protein VapI